MSGWTHVLCVILATCVPDAAARGIDRGIVLGLYSSDPAFDYATSLDEIRGAGASSVLVLVTLDQERVESPSVAPLRPGSAKTLQSVLRLAAARDLSTAVIPIVNLAELHPGKWRGTLAPPDWPAWFASYRGAVLPIARIASEEGAAMFVVGSELCSAERHSDQWSATIREVRRVFHGTVTYAGNWDHLPTEPFVRELDAIGLNAYYELVCDGQTPSAQVYRIAWQAVRDSHVLPWQRRFDKPLYFLEVGYPSAPGADRRPWDYTAAGSVDEPLQEQLYDAFLATWGKEPSVGGIYFYVWWEGAARDATGYTPRGKPAGEVLRTWYRLLARSTKTSRPSSPQPR